MLWSSDAENQALGGVPSVKAWVKLDPRIKSTVETHYFSSLQLSIYIWIYLNVCIHTHTHTHTRVRHVGT